MLRGAVTVVEVQPFEAYLFINRATGQRLFQSAHRGDTPLVVRIIARPRNVEIVDVAHPSRESDVADTVVMYPRPDLDSMPVREGIGTGGVCLRCGLDLLLEAESSGQHQLPCD